MVAFNLNDLGAVLNAGAGAINNYRQQSALSELGSQLQSGDWKGAARTALSAGDVGTGLKLLTLGQQREADASIAPLLGGIVGGGATAQAVAPPDASGPTQLPGGNIGEEFRKLGYGPNQIAGILGNFKAESNFNTGAVGDGGTSGGLGQWHNERLANLKNFAAQNGADWRDPKVQVAFTDHELRTSEAPVMQKLQAARTPQEAAMAFVGFERPQGWRPNNPAGAMHMDKRIAAANQFGGGQPVQVADASGSIPQSAAPEQDGLMARRQNIMRALATPGISDTAQQKLKLMLQDTEFQIQRGDKIDERDYRRQTIEQQRADKSEERQFRRDQLQQQSVGGQIRQRAAEADNLGLQGEDRTQFIANGKIPSGAEKQTGEQANAAIFATRMDAADKIISDPAIYGAGMGMRGAAKEISSGIPVVGNMIAGSGETGPQFQKYQQAKRDFVNAVLRKESGAAISQGEFANAEKQYFPQPGDGPEVIAQKAENRKTAIDTIGNAGTASFRKGFSEKRAAQGGPSVGAVEDGYRFKGGNPADPASWEKAH